MSGRIFEYYLTCDLSILKTSQAIDDLITNPDKYQFIWFCQNASKERIETLLSEENIKVLLLSSDAKYKIEGGILSGSVDNSLLKNKSLCEFIHKNNINCSGLLETSANDYLNFVEQHFPKEISQVFGTLYDGIQLNCLKTRQSNLEEINKLLYRCKRKSMNYIINNDSRISLDTANYSNFVLIAKNNVSLPDRVITQRVVSNIAHMNDVNKYRFLIEDLSLNNDLSTIELARKKYYEQELSSINSDGFLPEYNALLKRLENGLTMEDIKACLGDFDDNDEVITAIFTSKDKKSAIKRLNDYKISNMIIDYFFENIPSNVLSDMKEMLDFQNHHKTLTDLEFQMYSILSNIDELKTKDKISIFEKLKGKDLISKFYDDYSKAKDEMVNDFNASILNEENIEQFKNQSLSQQYDVPVYTLNGQPFKALIRGWGKYKDDTLEKSDIEHRADGASFSIDSSELLNPYQDPQDTYTIAYSSIPKKQLIHAFPTDSYTNYKRNRDLGIPDEQTLASTRKAKLMSPKELTSTSTNYNELLISVPNATRIGSEFDQQLEKPKPLAIYCYDSICDNDIEAAKKLGIGIILVETKNYRVDKSNRLNAVDTLSLGKRANSYDYLSKNGSDLRLDSMLSKPSPDTPKIAHSSEDYDID